MASLSHVCVGIRVYNCGFGVRLSAASCCGSGQPDMLALLLPY